MPTTINGSRFMIGGSMLNNKARQNHPRRGTTLVEVLGTLSLLLAIAVSAVSLLSTVSNLRERSKRSSQSRTAVDRLATKLRNDVHGASELKVADDGLSLAISQASESIEYRFDRDTNSFRRQVDEPKQTDSFELAEDVLPEISIKDGLVTFSLRKTSRGGPVWIVEAQQ